MTRMTRRRFLAMSAAATALPAQAGTTPMATWRGIALGAPASLRVVGMTEQQAAPIFVAVEGELARLENIFSLYRDGSEIRRLNATGQLSAPSPELLSVLSLAGAINAATDGAFDPTVQPLWQAAAGQRGKTSTTTGWHYLQYDSTGVGFTAPKDTTMGLTLNGIAQGYITDRIAALLHRAGLRDVLVDMGEVMARGQSAPGHDWRVGIANPQGQVVARLTMSDRALATSAPFAPSGQGQASGPHILSPTSKHQIQQALVSVSAPSAALADGLSTACCLLTAPQITQALSHFPGTRIEILQHLA